MAHLEIVGEGRGEGKGGAEWEKERKKECCMPISTISVYALPIYIFLKVPYISSYLFNLHKG